MTLNPYLEGLLAKASSEAKAANGTQFDQKIGGLDGWRHLVIALLANSGSLMTLTPYLEDVVADAEGSDAENARQFDTDIGGVDGWRHLAVALLGQLIETVQSGGGEGTGMPRSYLAGLTLSKGSGTRNFAVAPGACRDSTNAVDIVLPASMTKSIFNAWVEGSGDGVGSDDGQYEGEPSTETIHVWLIKNSTTEAVEVLTTTEAVLSPILPTGYTHFRRIGSFYCAGSGDIVPFLQIGDTFMLPTPSEDIGGFPQITNSPANYSMKVPLGIKVEAILQASLDANSSFERLWIWDPDLGVEQTQNNAFINSINGSAQGQVGAQGRTFTNASRQIRAYASAAGIAFITAMGWVDRRGRDD